MWRHGLPDGGTTAALPGARAAARWPLGARLAAAVFCLVAAGGGAITLATHLVARDCLTRQADQQLRSYAYVLASRPFTLFPGFRRAPGASGLGAAGPELSVAVLSGGGQRLISAGPAAPPAPGRSWLEISEPVSYRADHIPFVYGADDTSFSVSSKTRPGYAGTLVVGMDLADVGRTVDGLTVTCLQVSGLAMLLAAGAAAGIARWLVRPGALAGNTEAAGLDASQRTAAAVAQACSQLRRPLSVLAGLAEYYRGRGELSDEDAEHVMRQVADEAARLRRLVGELEPSARDAPSPKSAGR